MATYYLRSLTRREIWRTRIWALTFATACLAVCVVCLRLEITTPVLPHRFGIAHFVGIASSVWGWMTIYYFLFKRNRWLNLRHRFEIRVSPEGIFRGSPELPDLFLPWNEIVGFSEVRGGWLKIQTSRRKYFIAIPPYLDDASEFRKELSSYGIPQIDPSNENWAKTILFIICFVLGGILGGFAQNRILATCGWIVLATAFVWGIFETRRNPNIPRRAVGPFSVGFVFLFIVAAIIWIWHR